MIYFPIRLTSHSYNADFEVYLKSKIAEVQQQRAADEEKVICYSDPHDVTRQLYANPKYGKQLFQLIDSNSTRKSITTGSKASVYFTPNDSTLDQAQLQMSPMHINYIRENLDTYIDCMKPAASDVKFDFDMHRLQASLEQEVHRRRSQHLRQPSDDYDSAVDDTIEIDTEHTKMLNRTDDMESDTSSSMAGHCIRMNTLPKRQFTRNVNRNDFFYSMENVSDLNAVNGDFDNINHSNKTIDEATETLLTSSGSDNCSSGETIESNKANPSQSLLVLNEMTTIGLGNSSMACNSMPNIIDSTISSSEQSADEVNSKQSSNEYNHTIDC